MARITGVPYGPTVPAFLDMIAWSEGTSRVHGSDEGYNVLVGGSLFHDYSVHPLPAPGIYIPTLKIHSTAAGRYQLLNRYYAPYRDLLGLLDFSPISQDTIAIQQIRERDALALVQAGDILGAIFRCSNIWASLPGNRYGQHQQKVEHLLQAYSSALALA